MLITKEIEIDMAHRIPNHLSKCRNLHGHRYKIEVGVDGAVITKKGRSDEGMVIDFGDLKKILMKEVDNKYDHSAVFYEKDSAVNLLKKLYNNQDRKKMHFLEFVPTAENLAKHWYQILEKPLKRRNIKINHIKVWETPTSTAFYSNN